MSFSLQEYLTLKHTLRFKKDGTFKILLLTDPHGGDDAHPQLKPGMDAIVKEANPDLVLLGGDITGCHIGCETLDGLKKYLTDLTGMMEQMEIPWAHVYGNHDYNKGLSNAMQQDVFDGFPHCISKYGPRDIHGVGNYVLPILHSARDEVAFNVWGMDSHDDNKVFAREYNIPEDTQFCLANHFGMGYWSDAPHADQVVWYYETSKAIENAIGHKVPGMMYMHIPLLEFCLIPRNPAECGMIGEQREDVCCNELNSGLFSTCLQRGDVKAIFAGHDHLNDFTGVYCGIRLGNCSGINYDAGSDDDLRGGRVIELREEDPWQIQTYMLKLRDIMGKAADNRGRPPVIGKR
jgi:3',5'-cyclic AMP phosphodiesterase CpdA